jgi:hypothetical protein
MNGSAEPTRSMSGVSEFVRGVLRDSANGVVNDVFAQGYDAAAGVCLKLLSEKIDGLLGQIKAGRSLSEKDQFLLASLDDLRSEVDGALRDFWNADPQ